MDAQVFYKLVAQGIRRHRKHALLTQAELADRLAISRVSVNQIERGVQRPGLFLMASIALELDVPLEDLVPRLSESRVRTVLPDSDADPEIKKDLHALLAAAGGAARRVAR